MQKSEPGRGIVSATPDGDVAATRPPLSGQVRRRLLLLGGALMALAAAYSQPLVSLARFALGSELYSYILLIPFIAGYLAWTRRHAITLARPAIGMAAGFAVLAVIMATSWFRTAPNPEIPLADKLFIITGSFVFAVFAACALFLGASGLRPLRFPILFLAFMIPLPVIWERAISSFLQHGSADAAYWLIKLSGAPIYREGTLFLLPGIRLEVAPECSGIRSTFVLILTSLVAGFFFLRNAWSRSLLVAAVVVIGILRNAFRILTLAQLCIHVSPTMIDSPLHHRGGPVFFALSLIPLLALVLYLRKREVRALQREPSNPA